MGGGHLMTRKDYDIKHLISTLNKLHEEYPSLQLIMELGKRVHPADRRSGYKST